MKLNELTIAQAQEGLRASVFSAEELTRDCLDASIKKNGELNAYLDIYQDAVESAARADTILNGTSKNERLHLPTLLGIPLAIKDNILIEGRRTTASSRILEHYNGSYDATVITKLKSAGAIILGKTNMDEFAMGSSTENSAFGPTKHPLDHSRVPGGSSGGSAAAVGADICIAALGSDTGGSIRQPASFCGIVGLKPTYGSVSRHGLIALASSLDQIGPMTKTVADAEIVFNAIKGGDNFDSTALSVFPPTTKQNTPIRVGIPKEYFGTGLDSDVKQIIENALQTLGKTIEIKEISLPHSSYALPTYYIVVASEVSANLARLDGIRYGTRDTQSKNLLDVYRNSRAHGFGAETKRRIMLGTFALSAGYYDAFYIKAQKVRMLIRNDFEQAFKEVDIIAGPTTPTPAFAFGEKTDDPLQMYLADIYTVAVNLAGVPAISIPAGMVERNNVRLPVGLQLIGKWFDESNLLAHARIFESALHYGR